MQNIFIKDNTNTLGELSLLDYLPIDGLSIKADMFYILYTLKLNNLKMQGTYSDKFIVIDNILFIMELFVDKTIEGFGIMKGSSLKQIDLNNGNMKSISSLKDGYVYPKSVENNKIIYCKKSLSSSVEHEFEQELLPISN